MRSTRRGSVAAQLVAHLSQPCAPLAMKSAEIAAMFELEQKELTNRLRPSLERGTLVRERAGRGYVWRLARGPKPISACAWMADHISRLDLSSGTEDAPGETRLDPVERCARWVASERRRITWIDVVEHQGCHRFYAMRLLREGAERGLLRRIASEDSRKPDHFEGADCRGRP